MTFRQNSLIIGVSLACAAVSSSCVDDNYDLSDIDTTVRVEVNHLTVPIKLDEIKLESILKESDRVQIIDGQYTVVENGTFGSSPISIGRVQIASRKIASTELTLPVVPSAIASSDVSFDISTPAQTFGLSASGVPAEIVDINAVGATLKFGFNFNMPGLSSVAHSVEFRNLCLQLPKGLEMTNAGGGTYNPSTGELTLPTKVVSSETLQLEFEASRADFSQMDLDFDYTTHKVSVEGDIYVKSGTIAMSSSSLVTGAAPTNIKLSIGYVVPGFEITTFSGRVKYDIKGVNIPSVDLSDLPDVLTQSGTDISLANPCIFLSINNPVQNYDLTANTGMTINARHGSQLTPYSINDSFFTIGAGQFGGYSHFCLSPVMPSFVPDGYESPEHVAFSSLSNVLSGDGMPSSLEINLDNPCLPEQDVVNLPLGTSLGSVRGEYDFRAPVALTEGSKIVYADVADGWGSEDFDYMTITELNILATITSELPLALDIKAYPIDRAGNRINNVEIEGVHITASSQPQDVNIRITGDVTGFDGIRYEATATAGPGDKVLDANMSISVTNLRPTVSGYYQKEL